MILSGEQQRTVEIGAEAALLHLRHHSGLEMAQIQLPTHVPDPKPIH